MTRECGDCTLCCKLLVIPELGKRANLWCPHCEQSMGCLIHEELIFPNSCKEFDCLWKQGYGTEDMKPSKSKVVMGCTTDGVNLVLYVDTTRPNAWETPKFNTIIKEFFKIGRKVFIVLGRKRQMLTGVPK
jgi:hypothetical protein